MRYTLNGGVEDMQISIFSGSPRKTGNSSIIASKLEQEFTNLNNKVTCDIIKVSDLNIYPCTGCESCSNTSRCVIQDDMLEIYKKVQLSDVIVFVSPIYFGSITGQLKILIDRFQPFFAAKYLRKQPIIPSSNNKIASLIAVSGMDKQRFYENAQEIIKVFCINSNIKLGPGLYLGGVDYAGEINDKPLLKNKVSELAQLLID